ncbi:MAG: hypothetical protein J6T27_01830 [Alphaproteobacteria bacterium]|jgi:hypothetical protein|nr:hypothetical protein [Alphaproteobacteria bacterium]
MKKILSVAVLCLMPVFAVAADLVGTAHVNMTSDTAANAKKMAFDDARRQIIVDVLSPYSDVAALRSAVANEKNAVLTNLIESSGISGEKLSDTTYSANIKMTVNRMAAKNWLAGQDVHNWLSNEEETGGKFAMVVTLRDKFSDWGQIRRAANSVGADLETESINGNQIVFRVNAGRRGALTAALREAGWRYQDRDGLLHIFK